MSIKNTIHIIFYLLFFVTAQESFADYDKSELEITLTSVNGSETRIFVSFSGYVEPDSVNSFSYLKQRFIEGNILNEENVLFGFDDRYTCGGIYIYFSQTYISLDSIKSLKVNDLFNGSYMEGIESKIELEDKSWFTKTPIQEIQLKDGQFDYDIFIFERNKKLDNLIESFKYEYKKTFGAEVGDDNSKIRELIEKMNKYKVVVTIFGSGC
ncbi:hypothetical protein [Cytophaga aurantiaca]|uniref:hypothetical protein n=1 Tax=Cytophaga aurantiaca TaxID=29530 RepID=UPI000362AC88|nr:hypothetical protein [Cytophaga aurantiaca]